MSYCSTKCARLSRVAKVKEIQDKALDRGQFNRALGYRSASLYPMLSGVPSPIWRNGARVWKFD